MDVDTRFQCPVCASALRHGETQYRCRNGHAFDIARRGYVNLLLPHQKGAGGPGDSREMLQSRRAFLQQGYYQPVSDRLNALVAADLASGEPAGILDAGCGEGYYTWQLRDRLAEPDVTAQVDLYGIDVAKDAIDYASRRRDGIRFAVASNHRLPFLSASMRAILCLFAPRDEAEFRRVLEPDGALFVAAPGPRHLFGLRTALYEAPEPLGSKGDVREGFRLRECVNVSYDIRLERAEDILHLLTMTPYIRHAGEHAVAQLRDLPELRTEIDINILVYRKV